MVSLGIIGWPLKMTLSPKLHKYLFKITNLEGVYDQLPIEKIDPLNIKNLISKYLGLNITVPHKESVYEALVDSCISSDSVKNIGAVNTIVSKNGLTSLHNTDYIGFSEEISRLKFNAENKTILILGTGGSSKSIQFALRNLNPKKVYVASRTPYGEQIDYSDINSVSSEVNLVINTTPLGMPPYESESPLGSLGDFKDLDVLIDIGYSKKETKFMKSQKNAEVVNGIGMLIAQGIESFNLWTENSLNFQDLYEELKVHLEED